jgi:hypothetical protein
MEDLAEDARLRRGHLDIDFVGLEFDQGFAGGDGVAFLLQPARDAGVDDRLANFGNHDVHSHKVLLVKKTFTMEGHGGPWSTFSQGKPTSMDLHVLHGES